MQSSVDCTYQIAPLRITQVADNVGLPQVAYHTAFSEQIHVYCSVIMQLCD